MSYRDTSRLSVLRETIKPQSGMDLIKARNKPEENKDLELSKENRPVGHVPQQVMSHTSWLRAR
jgi:hypothetical protein